ncbi:hypothetical protein COLO4_28694 [Corchorus olitorius]|uniref:Uncharacterized protein n=1 Tax=Corchorus olitorius TaxID=93759 RepID=A0A1R3HIQ9_9ROSI|nr:hypothetical protein COLO4_28694 [Corchorus olitorius]
MALRETKFSGLKRLPSSSTSQICLQNLYTPIEIT